MSDEDRDEEEKDEWPNERGLVDMETRRQHSPELRMLDLIERLAARVETNGEDATRRVEETQRNMDFIVRQQAQFNTDMQRLRESQEHSERRWERIEQMWERTEESVRNLHAIAQIHENEITALAEAQARTGAQMAETDRRMAETDERINALVNTVERIISERRNGGQES
jgi:chromosome segregation ATPase